MLRAHKSVNAVGGEHQNGKRSLTSGVLRTGWVTIGSEFSGWVSMQDITLPLVRQTLDHSLWARPKGRPIRKVL